MTAVRSGNKLSQAEDRAAQEVGAATDVWRFAPYLEPADSKTLTLDIGRYASAVLFDKWPKMRHGASSDVAQTCVVTARIGVEDSLFRRSNVPTMR